MTKYTQTFKQQVIDFYFKYHESVTLKLNGLSSAYNTDFSPSDDCLTFRDQIIFIIQQYLNDDDK